MKLGRHVLPWEAIVRLRGTAVDAILRSWAKITDTHARGHMPRWAFNSLEWLASAPVQAWYNKLDDGPKKYYRGVLFCIASECLNISERDGCFISLNYAVRSSVPVEVPPCGILLLIHA